MSAITINWTGPALTSDQMHVIEDAALDFDSSHEDARLIFEHPLCDGMIECKGRMTHGIYRGRRFIATLDGTDGKPRTYEFLLTDYHSKSELRKCKVFWRFDTRCGTHEKVEAVVAKKTRTTTARRSRAN